MRDHIISEIKRLAALNDGRPPGAIVFARETGIADHLWRGKIWARWGDALCEAGYEPNAWTGRLDSEKVLLQVIAACRHYRRVPTNAEFDLYRHYDPTLPSNNAIARHFGRRPELLAALAKLAATDAQYADIAAMLPSILPASRPAAQGKKKPDGFVYLIKSGDFYKIGRSDNLERRVKEIRVAMPDKADLVHSIRTDDPAGIEAYWHQRFKDQRANGEWFKLSSLDISAFKRRTFQ